MKLFLIFLRIYLINLKKCLLCVFTSANMSTTTKNLGTKLKMLREVHNYTQEYVANILDIAPATYCLLEKGQAQFTIERIETLANLYKMDITDLLKISDQNIVHSITHSNVNGIFNENLNISQEVVSEEDKKFYTATFNMLREQNEKLIKLIDKLSEKLNM